MAGVKEKEGIKGTVVMVLRNAKTGEVKKKVVKNIVTDDGDLYYSQRACIEQPDDDHFTTGAAFAFDGVMVLFDGASDAPAKGNDYDNGTGLVSGSTKAMDGGYPKTNDDDSDNPTDPDVVTYRVSYATGEANSATIDDVMITNPSPQAGENVLMHADGLSVAKTSSDTLKVFVNHQMNGIL
jgi:hypothetical protein